MPEQCTHLVILRACDEDPEGCHAEAKIGHTKEPPAEVLEEYRAGIIQTFKAGFGHEPSRVGVAVLPWIEENDGEEYDDD